MPKLHGSDWFSGWRIQTQSVDHCPFPRASVNVTCWHAWHKVCERGSKGKWKLAVNANTIRGTVTDMAKGQNLTHSGFHWGTGGFMKKHTHWETAVTIWNTHWTCDTVAFNCRRLQLGAVSLHRSNSNYFFLSVSLFYLPVISSSLKACFSSLSPLRSPLPICALKGSLQLEGKQTQQRIFNWIVRSWLF